MPHQEKEISKLPKQEDGNGCLLHFSGGVRASKQSDNTWAILPILNNQNPSILGKFDQKQIETFARETSLLAVGIQRYGRHEGIYHSNFYPILPDQRSNLEAPSDLWGNIATNITQQRCGDKLRNLDQPTEREIAQILDNQGNEENFANAISLSLRSMDFHAERISEFYYDRLMSHMHRSLIQKEKSGGVGDQELYAHVHSFFLHLGTARDYLGAIIAAGLGKNPKINSMAKLLTKVDAVALNSDQLIEVLKNLGFVDNNGSENDKFNIAGWLKEVSDQRNTLVHERPYGCLLYTSPSPRDRG